jgi:HJR/Mrr/RecB family endonuclease
MEWNLKPIFQSMLTIIGFMFAFWPLIVLAAFQQLRNLLVALTVMWAFASICWIGYVFTPVSQQFHIIPEPLNTVLFFLTGVFIVGWHILGRIRDRRELRIKADQAQNAADLLRLYPTDFENMVVEYYLMLGHKARRTGSTGDHGVDIIVQAKNGEKWAVQCKRWKGKVGEPVVRDFYGMLQNEKADHGAIIAIGGFTVPAHEWSRGKPITLVDGDTFLAQYRKMRARPS